MACSASKPPLLPYVCPAGGPGVLYAASPASSRSLPTPAHRPHARSCTGTMLPLPPNLSLAHPYTTWPNAMRDSAPAHMMHGSHVTYSVQRWKAAACWSPPCSPSSLSIAINSACRVPCDWNAQCHVPRDCDDRDAATHQPKAAARCHAASLAHVAGFVGLVAAVRHDVAVPCNDASAGGKAPWPSKASDTGSGQGAVFNSGLTPPAPRPRQVHTGPAVKARRSSAQKNEE